MRMMIASKPSPPPAPGQLRECDPEQDHRAFKRVTRPMLNFKSFRSAGSVLAGIELIHMTRLARGLNRGDTAIDKKFMSSNKATLA
jgi:hypothetical protein